MEVGWPSGCQRNNQDVWREDTDTEHRDCEPCCNTMSQQGVGSAVTDGHDICILSPALDFGPEICVRWRNGHVQSQNDTKSLDRVVPGRPSSSSSQPHSTTLNIRPAIC